MKNRINRDYIWNTLAGIINASEAVIMSMIATRLGSLADAGILTIAFAVGNLSMMIGKYGIRSFQVTDSQGTFSFVTYFSSRIITVLIMLLTAVVYVIQARVFHSFDVRKCIIILIISIIYTVESLEDVFWGELQRIGKMYLGAQLFVARWIVILISFFIAMLMGYDMLISLGVSMVLSVVTFCVMILFSHRIVYEMFRISEETKVKPKWNEMWRLLLQTSPLFLVSFFMLFINNAPKYFLAVTESDEVQACFGFVAMPVFVIGLLNGFIYQPSLVRLAEARISDHKKYNKMVSKQFALIAILSVICILGAYLIGLPVLSWLYHTDLREFKNELLILQVSGGFLAAAGYTVALVTIIRQQKKLLIGLGVTLFFELFSMSFMIKMKGTVGAAVDYLICVFILFIIYVFTYIIENKRIKKLSINAH